MRSVLPSCQLDVGKLGVTALPSVMEGDLHPNQPLMAAHLTSPLLPPDEASQEEGDPKKGLWGFRSSSSRVEVLRVSASHSSCPLQPASWWHLQLTNQHSSSSCRENPPSGGSVSTAGALGRAAQSTAQLLHSHPRLLGSPRTMRSAASRLGRASAASPLQGRGLLASTRNNHRQQGMRRSEHCSMTEQAMLWSCCSVWRWQSHPKAEPRAVHHERWKKTAGKPTADHLGGRLRQP